MRLKKTRLTLGLLIIIISLSGVPSSWKNPLVVLFALGLVGILLILDYLPAITERQQQPKEEKKEEPNMKSLKEKGVFVDNYNFNTEKVGEQVSSEIDETNDNDAEL